MKQQGVALLTVLLLLALMVLLASTISERGFFSYQRAVQQQQTLQARWYALGAEEVAGRILLQDAQDDPEHTHLAQFWASSSPVFPLEDAQLHGTLQDMQGCFNLNAINQQTGPSGDYPAQVFTLLLQNLGVDEWQSRQITAALQDWITDSPALHPNGAGDDEYAALIPPYLRAQQPLQQVSELRLVRGITPELMQRLRPLICVLPENQLLVNINTLRTEQNALLAALLLNQISPATATELLALRPRTGWNSSQDVLKLPLLKEQTALFTTLSQVLVVNSRYFQSRIHVQFAEYHYVLHSLLLRHRQQIQVLQRYQSPYGE